MKKFIILIMITMIFLLVFVAGGLAKPDYRSIDITLYNPCTDEDVAIIGTVQTNERTLFDSAGGIHVKLQLKWHFTGTGESGTKYIANGTANYQFNGELPYPYEETGILIITCISKGDASNLKLKVRYHITVNANGETTADFFFGGEVECTGKQP